MGQPQIPGTPRRRARAASAPTRAPLSPERIAQAALAVIDEGGVDALNMRAVADRLGTGPASLYAPVDSKDALLDLVYDRVIAELDVPAVGPEGWAEALKETMRRQREVLRAHRDVARVSLGRVPTGPGAMPVIERLLAVLRAGGLPDRLVGLAPDLAALYVDAITLEETYYDPTVTAEEAAAWEASLHEHLANLPADEFPNLRAAADPLLRPDTEERFEFGLEVIVRGLQAIAEDERGGR